MKKSELKMMIREVVREEIRLALKEVIGGSKQQIKKPQPPKKQNYTKNAVLNEVLNETTTDDWETMGGSEYTSERMGEIIGGTYKDLMGDNQPQNGGVSVEGQSPDFLKKDYRKLMKAVDKKKQQKMGG